MEIAPGIHNVITEQAPAPGVTNTYLIIGTEGAVWVERAAEPPGPQSDRSHLAKLEKDDRVSVSGQTYRVTTLG